MPENLLISDCIHAVAAVDPIFGREHYPLIRIGKPASRYIAREIMTRGPARGIEQERYDNSWLIPRLGLDRYPSSRPARAHPKAELRALPVPGVKHHCRRGWIGPRFDGAATSSRSRSVDAED